MILQVCTSLHSRPCFLAKEEDNNHAHSADDIPQSEEEEADGLFCKIAHACVQFHLSTLSVSRRVAFVAHLLHIAPFPKEPVEHDRHESKSGAVPGAGALVGFGRANFPLEIELTELNRAGFVGDTKGPNGDS